MLKKQQWSFAAVVVLCWKELGVAQAFVLRRRPGGGGARSKTNYRGVWLYAKPQRLRDNVEGVVYVNDKCINCAACGALAPDTFTRSSSHHIVSKQPETREEILRARAALAACPVAAIRVETLAERRHRAAVKVKVKVESLDEQRKNTKREAVVVEQQEWSDRDQELVRLMGLNVDKSGLEKPFPRPFLAPNKPIANVYWTGYHNEASFGAVPYLFQTSIIDKNNNNSNKPVWIMVDTPRFSPSALQAVTSLTGPLGPAYLFFTHVDDTADHGKWAHEFAPNLKRIFHSGDLGRYNWIGDKTLEQVEILLPSKATRSGSSSLTAYSLEGDVLPDDWNLSTSPLTHPVVILHTPGHSPGSCTLYKRPKTIAATEEVEPGILFTGDTYAYTTSKGGYMTGFPRYGHDLLQQSETLPRLLQLDWDVIAPGHGHPRDYRGEGFDNKSDDETMRVRQTQEMQTALDELRAGKWN